MRKEIKMNVEGEINLSQESYNLHINETSGRIVDWDHGANYMFNKDTVETPVAILMIGYYSDRKYRKYRSMDDLNIIIQECYLNNPYIMAHYTYNIIPDYTQTGARIYTSHMEDLYDKMYDFSTFKNNRLSHYIIQFDDVCNNDDINIYFDNIIKFCSNTVQTIFNEYQVLIFIERRSTIHNNDGCFRVHLLINNINIHNALPYMNTSYSFKTLLYRLNIISLHTTNIPILIETQLNIDPIDMIVDMNNKCNENFILNCEYKSEIIKEFREYYN